ncbi:MAG TPA: hypothetical protein VKT73_12075 [Xanthobacteraceae bacterium]|nr:hypothetical protein [Xanthobacteraceae bacterium]
MSAAPAPRQNPLSTRDEAEALLSRIGETMVALVQVFEDETRLVRAGKLSAAADLVSEKTNLAARYLREFETVKANAKFIRDAVPELVEEMRRAHASFRDILNRNLRTVATAQSVAEGIVRGAAEEASRRANPHGYRADGRSAPTKTASRPVIISRSS